VIVNIEGSLRDFRAEVGALLRPLSCTIFIVIRPKFPQMRRQIRQERIVLVSLVEVAHPLVEYVELLLLLELNHSAPRPLLRLLVVVVYRVHAGSIVVKKLN
jgi:hypothetical protein